MTSDGKLQALYFELGVHQKSRGEAAKAADTFALALYYARRTSNRELVQRCREEVAICNPSHIVCREASAPLYFAQLLMRHPPEEAEQELEELKRQPFPLHKTSPATNQTELQAASHGHRGGKTTAPAKTTLADDIFQYAKVDPSCGIFEFPPKDHPTDAPAAWLTAIEEEALLRPEPLPETLPEEEIPHKLAPRSYKTEPVEAHHAFPYVLGHHEGKETPAKSVDDYLFSKEAPAPRVTLPPDESASWLDRLVQTGAIASVLLGIAAIGFFSVELYQARERLDPTRLVERIRMEVDSSVQPTMETAEMAPSLEDPTHEFAPPVPQIGRHPASGGRGTPR